MHIMMGGTKNGFYPEENLFKLKFRALENRKGHEPGMSLWARDLSAPVPVKWGESLSQCELEFEISGKKWINFWSDLRYLHGRSYRSLIKQAPAEDWALSEEWLRSAAPSGCQIQQNYWGITSQEDGAGATNLKEFLKPAPAALGAEKEKSAAFGFNAAGDPSKEEITWIYLGDERKTLKIFLVGSYSF